MPGFTTAAHIISSNEKEEEDEGETWRSGATMEAGGDVLGLDASQVEEVAPGVSQTSQAATSKVNGEASSDLSASSTPLFATKIAAAATATATTTTTSKKHHYNNIFRNDQSLVKNGGKTSKRKTKTKSQMKATQNYMYRKSNTVPESLLEFVAEIHEQDRITPLEEVLLGEKTQAAIELQSIHTSLAEELGRPPSDGEWCARAGKLNVQALEDILSEGLEAKNKLVTSNLRLVQRVVNVYIRNGLSSQYNAGDLMQEGTIALIRAAEKFQPSKGFRFSTYAMFWIRASVKRSQLSQSREISVPQRVQEVYKKMQIVKKDIEDRGDKPVMQEIANIMGVKVEVLEKAERAMSQKTYSLDSTITNRKKASSGVESGSSTITSNLYRFVESKFDLNDPHIGHGEGGVERELSREAIVCDLRRHLDTERAELVILRYGLEDVTRYYKEDGMGSRRGGRGDGLSIKELAGIKGMKQDKVRRIIKTSLVKLKPHMGEWLEQV